MGKQDVNNSSEHNENICYYCGRSKNDLEKFLDEKMKMLVLNEINPIKDQIAEKKDGFRKVLREIIEDPEGNEYLKTSCWDVMTQV